MSRKDQTDVEMQKELRETIINLKKVREELDSLEKKGTVRSEQFRKLREAEQTIVDSTLRLIEKREGVSDGLEKANRLVNEARLNAWRDIASDKTEEVKAELFSLWYSDKELEKEFETAKSIIETANSEADKGVVEEAVRNYDHGIDKLASVYGGLSKIKERSSMRNMAKFIIWGIPFVFTIAQFLATNTLKIAGYGIPWFTPLIGLAVGCLVVWGWVRSKRSTKEGIIAAIIAVLVWMGIIAGITYISEFLGARIEIAGSMMVVMGFYIVLIVLYFIMFRRRSLRMSRS